MVEINSYKLISLIDFLMKENYNSIVNYKLKI